ncbi:hypothetical protein DICPUDRAFT_157359 [Dictyostelium purpureum]|uniref:THH1/TOM1/TOM3 domain-containing protein n=1 Tax=Dictyostelium purpureum TaxID=5786 RepID=F0ZYX8_DICPU|nr:uncharacterized protein DICPUDRAFT_157359 [Dictyostelium purpureum]EGC30857.1 hypothetical protein DICPUDRAFT_157359 [Dictyostelium purpureum]|eukprot:XP_003292623.1 hypothetical protein DICPUDRAFT_157359 [Dictyostelium purpureum]
MNNTTINLLQTPKRCYCEPSFEQKESECNPAGCKTVASLILIGYVITLSFCLYRLNQLRVRKDNKWPLLSLSLLIITCLARVVRAVLTLYEEENFYVMGLLFLLPMGILICSFFNTLFVWVKIIFHFNFSKVVSKVFPFLGKIFLGSQIVLIALLLIICFSGLRYNASNIVLFFFLAYGGISAVIFTKMIWSEYKDLSGKDSGVFNSDNHQKILKIFKLSITSIVVTFATLALTVWSFTIDGVLTISHTIAFNFIGRSIEIAWISVMLIILAPQLQTWSQSSTKESTNFDSASDSSSSSSKSDIENNDDKKETIPTVIDIPTTTAIVTTSPVNSSNINTQNQIDNK